jgi:lysozyme
MAIADRLLKAEALRLTVYDDATGKSIQPGSHVIGNPTIGIGTLICAPGGITADEAQFLLNNRIEIAADATEAIVGASFRAADPTRFDVLTEMAFQMGGSGLAKFANMLQSVKESRWNDAANDMLESTWATQTPVRAQTLAKIMRSGR